VRARQVGKGNNVNNVEQGDDLLSSIIKDPTILDSLGDDEKKELFDYIINEYENGVWKLHPDERSVFAMIQQRHLGDNVYNACQHLLMRDTIYRKILKNKPNICNLNEDDIQYVVSNVINVSENRTKSIQERNVVNAIGHCIQQNLQNQKADDRRYLRAIQKGCNTYHAGNCKGECIWSKDVNRCVPKTSVQGKQAKLPLSGNNGPLLWQSLSRS
jgi:hypothetical protein